MEVTICCCRAGHGAQLQRFSTTSALMFPSQAAAASNIPFIAATRPDPVLCLRDSTHVYFSIPVITARSPTPTGHQSHSLTYAAAAASLSGVPMPVLNSATFTLIHLPRWTLPSWSLAASLAGVGTYVSQPGPAALLPNGITAHGVSAAFVPAPLVLGISVCLCLQGPAACTDARYGVLNKQVDSTS